MAIEAFDKQGNAVFWIDNRNQLAQKIAKEYNFQLPQYNERQEECKQEYVQPEPEKAVKKIRTIEINLEDTDEEVCIILNGIKMLLNFGKA